MFRSQEGLLQFKRKKKRLKNMSQKCMTHCYLFHKIINALTWFELTHPVLRYEHDIFEGSQYSQAR